MRKVVLSILILLALVLCVWISAAFIRSWFEPPPLRCSCKDHFGHDIYPPTAYINDPTYAHCKDFFQGKNIEEIDQRRQKEVFDGCIKERAELFAGKDYSEAKDLAKAFLTLLTAVLVASITFSEKIVDFNNSGWWSRGFMISCWILLLAAIASCGAGLALMTSAFGYATYSPYQDYGQFEHRAGILYIIAGLSFGTGLMSLLIAGIIALIERHKT
ncbi:MAG TPA: hypothetical protein VE713_14035 [Pyrinomonadaceae bacterium]|nr:hypothetical protein [Pyrinomonadaceae bacterium]